MSPNKRILLGGHAPEVLTHLQGFFVDVEAGSTLLSNGFIYSLTGKPESLSTPSPSRPPEDSTLSMSKRQSGGFLCSSSYLTSAPQRKTVQQV